MKILSQNILSGSKNTAVALREHYDLSNWQRLDSSFNNLFSTETNDFENTKALHCWLLWGRLSTSDQWIPSQRFSNAESFPCHHTIIILLNPDSKVHGANMGPIWGRQDPGGQKCWPHELYCLESITFHDHLPWSYWFGDRRVITKKTYNRRYSSWC